LDLQVNKLGRKIRKLIWPLRATVLDDNVLSFNITRIMQTFPKSIYMWRQRWALAALIENADNRHL
jgi:hypothetical protein